MSNCYVYVPRLFVMAPRILRVQWIIVKRNIWIYSIRVSQNDGFAVEEKLLFRE